MIEDAALSEYDRLNAKTSAWHRDGRVAAQLFAFVVAQGDTYGEGLLALADRYADRAWEKSCRDPLILAVCDVYMYSYRDFHSNDSRGGNRHLSDAQAMLSSGYPVICKLETAAVAMKNLTSLKHNEKPLDDLTALLAAIPAFLDQTIDSYAALVESAPPEHLLYRKATFLYDNLDEDADFLSTAGEGIDTALAAAKSSGALRAYCQADCLINLAWAARGTGWADSVTPEGWDLMRERLGAARKVLTAACAAFPTEKRPPALMMTVELGDGGSIEAMNLLFEKATGIDPGFRSPYNSKMYFLQPKWHGSPRAVLDFGLACLATGRWDDCIPMVLVNGLAQLATQNETLYDNATVWKLFSETNQEFLRRYPRSVLYRTRYLDAAVKGKKWDVARDQLKILGDQWDHSVLSAKQFDNLKAAIPGDA